MKSKLIAIVGGFVVLMLTNGAIYGGLLADHFAEMMKRAPEGAMHESMGFIFAGHFIQTLLLVGLFSRMKVHTAKEGFVTSALLHLGMFGIFNCFILGTLTFFQPIEMAMDVAINMLTGGLGGLAIGAILGKFSEEQTADA